MRKIFDLFGRPTFLQSFHGWATIAWFATSAPQALVFGNSVLFVTWLSLYAIVTGHWSSWQAARVEVAQEQNADKKLDEILEWLAKLEGKEDMPVAGEIIYTRIPYLVNHATCSVCGSPIEDAHQDTHTAWHLNNNHVVADANGDVTVKLIDNTQTPNWGPV